MKINPDTLCIEFEPEDCPFNLAMTLGQANQKLREFQESFPIGYTRPYENGAMDIDTYQTVTDTHMLRLIGPVPLVQDTAESLLRELIKTYDVDGTVEVRDLVKRAKALLERGEVE